MYVTEGRGVHAAKLQHDILQHQRRGCYRRPGCAGTGCAPLTLFSTLVCPLLQVPDTRVVTDYEEVNLIGEGLPIFNGVRAQSSPSLHSTLGCLSLDKCNQLVSGFCWRPVAVGQPSQIQLLLGHTARGMLVLLQAAQAGQLGHCMGGGLPSLGGWLPSLGVAGQLSEFAT
jgi:hypothetical protein